MNDRSRNTHTPPAWPHFTISRTKKETFIEESVEMFTFLSLECLGPMGYWGW